jgi:hypothetical protein
MMDRLTGSVARVDFILPEKNLRAHGFPLSGSQPDKIGAQEITQSCLFELDVGG